MRKTETQIDSNNKVDRNQSFTRIVEIMVKLDKPASCREIAATANLETHAVSSRLRELIDAGVVFTSHKVKCPTTNRSVMSYTLNESDKVIQDEIVCDTVKDRNFKISNTNVSIDKKAMKVQLMLDGTDAGTLDLNSQEVKDALNNLFLLARKQF